jgi:alkylated DNA repair dioxygenase AlkB
MLDLQPNANLLPFDGELYLFSSIVSEEDSRQYMLALQQQIQWKQEGMRMFGKYVDFPRLTAWYADEGKYYSYSGLVNKPLPWLPSLMELKSIAERLSDHSFNSVLLNYYRTGNDSMGWHSDDEPELGMFPSIASLNFGAVRKIQFRHKSNKDAKVEVILPSGSLLLMKGKIQRHWQHQVPKQKKIHEARINLTFRQIL